MDQVASAVPAGLRFAQVAHHVVLEGYNQAVEAARARRDRLTARIEAMLPAWTLAPFGWRCRRCAAGAAADLFSMGNIYSAGLLGVALPDQAISANDHSPIAQPSSEELLISNSKTIVGAPASSATVSSRIGIIEFAISDDCSRTALLDDAHNANSARLR
jgi:hypothetical protein